MKNLQSVRARKPLFIATAIAALVSASVVAVQPAFADDYRACVEYSSTSRYSATTAQAIAYRSGCSTQVELGVRGRYVRPGFPDTTMCESGKIGINITADCTYPGTMGDTYRSQHQISSGGWIDGPLFTW
jgi:hypothetical protein